jgi:acyl-coenzyme A synthetase/AMP-(fatty) acid ligase
VSAAEIRALSRGLADFQRPKKWRWAASLPRTALGKLQRQHLAQHV